MSQLNERLTEARIAKGMNKTAFAKAVRVSQPTVTDWENGKMRPNGENLTRVCHVLGVTPEWLLTGRGPVQAEGAGDQGQVLSPEDAALLDDLGELLPEDAARYRAAIRAEADKARRYRGKPTAARLLSAPPAGETLASPPEEAAHRLPLIETLISSGKRK